MGSYEHRTKTSKPFIYFWELMATRKSAARARERARYVLKPVDEYRKNTRKILEIGCGRGEVLVNLPKKYAIYGLDIERDYIEFSKKRIPHGTFFVSSMHNFKLDEKFDAIFSADDAVNFLKDFEQWKSTFKAVDEHLNSHGLFIFDVFTPKMLRDTLRESRHNIFAGTPWSVREYPWGYYFDKAIIKGNTLTWDCRIFEKLPDGLYQLNEYKFKE
jgi:trans-aconitate methyltransferase